MKVLCVDFGTSSVKMSIYDENIREIVKCKISYNYDVNGLYAQIDPSIIYRSFIEGCDRLKEHIKDIDVLAFAVFSPCLIAMDREGNALYPAIIHLDRRSYAQSRFALKQLDKNSFLKINGNLPFPGGISLTSILWLKQMESEIYNKTVKFGHLNTYIYKKLIDKFLIDPTNASFTGLYNTISGDGWSNEITGALGIDKQLLPEVQKSLSIAGYISTKAAKQTGLKEGLPVLVGSNDSTAATYGVGAVKHGDIANISGSSEIVTVVTENPVPNEKFYCRSSVEEGKWVYLAITVGGFALEWFRREFCREIGQNEFYNEYLQQVVTEESDTKVKFLPHLSGDRHSLLKKRAAFSGLVMDTTREEMLRSLLRGTFDPILESLRILKKQMVLNHKIYLTGGMISEEYHKFKEKTFGGFEFVSIEDGTTRGLVKQAVATLNNG